MKLVDVYCTNCSKQSEEFVDNSVKFGDTIKLDQACECGSCSASVLVSAPDIRTENSHTLIDGTRDNFDGGQLKHMQRVIQAQAAYQNAKYKKIGNLDDAKKNLKDVTSYKK